MITRGQNYKQVPLNVCGSSIFGRYPKISIEKTNNMFESDEWMVPYAGYEIAILASKFAGETKGRGIYSSTKLGKMIVVLDANVYSVSLTADPFTHRTISTEIILLGTLFTDSGVVYIAENNKPQILISDNTSLYIYDQTLTPPFQPVTGLDFIPGYITFHDTYFICAAQADSFYSPPATNTWRLSDQNDGTSWPSMAANIGLIETKSDNTKAVVRFPSKGNLIFVMGSNVTEAWFDTGAQLFPYQRTNQYNIDYGCLSPATVAYMDEYVVWLAANEKSGPIIMRSDGGMPEKITTDGIDYLFAQLNAPQDSQAFIYRQDGHLFYHINFYTDNLSLFIDFLADGSHKIYNATDQNLNYFIASEVAFFNNQYYFVSRNTGNLYAFDTIFTTYEDTDADQNVEEFEIPRFRVCKQIRTPSQDSFVGNDAGFTIEMGETNYQQQDLGPVFWLTEDGKFLVITEGSAVFLLTELGDFITLENGAGDLLAENSDLTDFDNLIFEQDANSGFGPLSLPRVDLSVSYDGGASFGNDFAYVLNPIGQRKNKLQWWQLGWTNDLTCMFKFWGMGRFVATDGIVNIRL